MCMISEIRTDICQINNDLDVMYTNKYLECILFICQLLGTIIICIYEYLINGIKFIIEVKNVGHINVELQI